MGRERKVKEGRRLDTALKAMAASQRPRMDLAVLDFVEANERRRLQAAEFARREARENAEFIAEARAAEKPHVPPPAPVVKLGLLARLWAWLVS